MQTLFEKADQGLSCIDYPHAMKIQGGFRFYNATLQVPVESMLDAGSLEIQKIRCFDMDIGKFLLVCLVFESLQGVWSVLFSKGICLVVFQWLDIGHSLAKQRQIIVVAIRVFNTHRHNLAKMTDERKEFNKSRDIRVDLLELASSFQ